ncbi:hypothetical protein Tco_0835488 [Tanacetum coccineum]
MSIRLSIEDVYNLDQLSNLERGVNATDLLNQGWQQDFEYFTRCESSAYRRELLENLDTLEAVIHRVVNTYGVLRMKENELNALKENGSQLHDEILHEHQIKSSVKMQLQDIQISPVQAMDDSLIVSKSSLIESENHNAFSKSEIETQMQRQEEKVNMREAVDAGLVVTESSGTKPDKQDTSSSSGNYTTQAVDADIGPVNDEEPFAEGIHCISKFPSIYIQLFWNTLTYDAKTGVYITSLPEITPFISPSQRVARLEQEMSEVKKTDHSADVLASIKSQVPTVVDKYLGTKLDDALLKILERHTADLIKYSALPGPESIKNQEYEKSPKEIIRIKREQGEEKQDSTYSIRSTDKMKDAMDKELRVKVKDHKESMSAKRKTLIAAIWSAQPPSKDDHQSSKKPRESDASASKQHPALTSTGWQITDTRDDVVNSLMHMLPNNIQITDTSLMHMLNLNPSPHKEDSLVLLSEIPLLCQRRGLLIRLRSLRNNPGTGGSNEGTGNILGVPDESTVISRASSEGTGSKPGVPDEEKLIL